MDVTIAPERVNEIANKATSKLNSGIVELRRLFLVENMMDSIKFGLSLWVLTYIGREDILTIMSLQNFLIYII